MTFDELQQTCLQALATGKIGTPVAMTLHLQVSDSDADPTVYAAALMEFASTVFDERASRLLAHGGAQQRQCRALVNFAGGQTLLVCAGCGSAAESQLQLLLIGNRGIVRLEGAECGLETKPAQTESVEVWVSKIRESQTSDSALQLS